VKSFILDLKKDRIFVAIFRAVAAVLILFGILAGLNISGSETNYTGLLFYTYQSNILAMLFLLVLAVRTVVDIIKNGRVGPVSYFERFSAFTALSIFITMFIFWPLLAPLGLIDLWTFDNLMLHLFAPLLMIADYLLFTKCGKLKKNDAFLFMIGPLFYYIQATILGFSGVSYGVFNDVEYFFPYFFMDYYTIGWWVAAFVPSMFVALWAMGHGLFVLDRKRGRQKEEVITVAEEDELVVKL